MERSIIVRADSYKASQWVQYPDGTEYVFSYIESRGGEYNEQLFFGLQYLIKRYLMKPITMADVDYGERTWKAHGLPFNRAGWEHIVKKHGGKLPLEIRAVKEGTILAPKNILAYVINTDKKCFWLTSYIETLLLKVWYPMTVATLSFKCKTIIKKYLKETGDLAGLPFKLHDFGYRGVSSEESAEIGGAAHLVNFMGTDTIAATFHLEDYYNAKEMTGFSIPATEHSTITSWTREGEKDAYANVLKQFAKSPIVACVSDSYNIYEAIKMWGKLKEKIKKNNQILVVRPDSGDPVRMSLECVLLLNEHFGSVRNDKGYKVLNHVRVIYGDGISNPKIIEEILENLKREGFSADNIAFGMGGGLLQKCDRDTMKFAMKCSAIIRNGEVVDVYKDPITDPGKTSKKGFLDLIKVDGEYKTIQTPSLNQRGVISELETVFRNGELLRDQSIDDIRAYQLAKN